MAALAKGRSVLDAYSYTGGFGIAAAKAGATEVICLDSSAARACASRTTALRRTACRANSSRPTCSRNSSGWPPRRRHSTSSSPIRRPSCARARIWSRAPRPIASWRVWRPQWWRRAASCCSPPARTISPMERFAAECAAGIARAGRSAALIRQAGAGADHPVHPHAAGDGLSEGLVYALD